MSKNSGDFERTHFNVESFKRRRALSPFSALDLASRTFFKKILYVKKSRDLIFITKECVKEA